MDPHQMYTNIRKINQEKYNIGSKKRLMGVIDKKFQTAMIGTLARCEEHFGELWGHGKDTRELNEDQKQFRILWTNLRTEILNHCNSQLRAIIDEMMLYNITYNKYQTEFIVNKNYNS